MTIATPGIRASDNNYTWDQAGLATIATPGIRASDNSYTWDQG